MATHRSAADCTANRLSIIIRGSSVEVDDVSRSMPGTEMFKMESHRFRLALAEEEANWDLTTGCRS
jgi:hypothetical protein